ncbi:hypothetical protein [Colwellia maritima]
MLHRNDSRAIMNESSNVNRRRVNNTECTSYLAE